MSVASKNLFALLDDDAQEAPPPATQKKEVEAAQTPNAKKSQNQQHGKGPASRGGRYYQRGAKSSNPVSGSTENVDDATDARRKRDGDQRGRGRGGRGGRGRGRGGGGGRGREFDRHSGALPDSEKRVHQGWGGDDADRELQNETSAVVDATVESTGANNDWAGETTAANDWAGAGEAQAADWDAPAATEATPTAETKDAEPRRRRFQEEEEDDNTLTLDQYLAQKKQTTAELPKLEGVRKANEGSDEALWKNAVQNGKEDEEEHYFVGKGKSAPKSKAKKAEKEFIEIDARFERPNRGGRGRGRGSDERRGRGGRGGRGGGGGGNSNNRNTGVDVADQTAFPSLS